MAIAPFRTGTLDVLMFISLAPVMPVLATWFLPWERWIPKFVSNKVLGPYLIYCAFGAWYFGMPTWFIVVVLLFGIGVSAVALSEIKNSIVSKQRRSQALRWSIADGVITRFTTGYGSPTTPQVVYTYDANGEAHYGEATGAPMKDDQINHVKEVSDSLGTVRVRYDPADPDRSRLLNEDNPRIPFEVDHREH